MRTLTLALGFSFMFMPLDSRGIMPVATAQEVGNPDEGSEGLMGGGSIFKEAGDLKVTVKYSFDVDNPLRAKVIFTQLETKGANPDRYPITVSTMTVIAGIYKKSDKGWIKGPHLNGDGPGHTQETKLKATKTLFTNKIALDPTKVNTKEDYARMRIQFTVSDNAERQAPNSITFDLLLPAQKIKAAGDASPSGEGAAVVSEKGNLKVTATPELRKNKEGKLWIKMTFKVQGDADIAITSIMATIAFEKKADNAYEHLPAGGQPTSAAMQDLTIAPGEEDLAHTGLINIPADATHIALEIVYNAKDNSKNDATKTTDAFQETLVIHENKVKDIETEEVPED